jgi:hypothetical protein
MLDRRSLVANGGAAAFGALALTAVTTGTATASAAPAGHNPWVPLPDPATTPVPTPPFPEGLTREERRNLETFGELDFDVFTHQKWARLGESHCGTSAARWTRSSCSGTTSPSPGRSGWPEIG